MGTTVSVASAGRRNRDVGDNYRVTEDDDKNNGTITPGGGTPASDITLRPDPAEDNVPQLEKTASPKTEVQHFSGESKPSSPFEGKQEHGQENGEAESLSSSTMKATSGLSLENGHSEDGYAEAKAWAERRTLDRDPEEEGSKLARLLDQGSHVNLLESCSSQGTQTTLGERDSNLSPMSSDMALSRATSTSSMGGTFAGDQTWDPGSTGCSSQGGLGETQGSDGEAMITRGIGKKNPFSLTLQLEDGQGSSSDNNTPQSACSVATNGSEGSEVGYGNGGARGKGVKNPFALKIDLNANSSGSSGKLQRQQSEENWLEKVNVHSDDSIGDTPRDPNVHSRRHLQHDPEKKNHKTTELGNHNQFDLTLQTSGEMDMSFGFSNSGAWMMEGFDHRILNTGIAGGVVQSPSSSLQTINLMPVQHRVVNIRKLGKGCSATVYKCVDLSLMKLVALKTIQVYDSKKRHQMGHELSILYDNMHNKKDGDLSRRRSKDGFQPPEDASQHIVELVDAFSGHPSGTVSIMLEIMNGGSLQDLIDNGHPLDEAALQYVAMDSLKGLAYIHALKFLHRDIKPANILLTADGICKISDFGIGREIDVETQAAETFVGTLTYMSPERLNGEKYTFSADVWSLGLSLMASAYGRFPLKNGGYWTIKRYVDGDLAIPGLPEPREGQLPWSKAAIDFIASTMELDPKARASCGSLLLHPFVSNMKLDSTASRPCPLCKRPDSQAVKSTKRQKELREIRTALTNHFVAFAKEQLSNRMSKKQNLHPNIGGDKPHGNPLKCFASTQSMGDERPFSSLQGSSLETSGSGFNSLSSHLNNNSSAKLSIAPGGRPPTFLSRSISKNESIRISLKLFKKTKNQLVDLARQLGEDVEVVEEMYLDAITEAEGNVLSSS